MRSAVGVALGDASRTVDGHEPALVMSTPSGSHDSLGQELPRQRRSHRRRARRRSRLLSGLAPERLSARWARVVRVSCNVVGAAGAAYFAWATLRFYLQTHRLIGAAFLVEQMLVVIAYLVRRPARAVSRRPGDWLLAFGGTFGGVLLRPGGAHPHWGASIGLWIQLLGLLVGVVSFLTLGRSFGFAAADRGLVRRGPYAVVRHPIYGSYLLLQSGYLLQSMSVGNVLVVMFVTGCNVGRALVEDRVLATTAQHAAYRSQVRWRMLPGIW
jgi:protein-S-isoprenylcysteine O-methyltransferase Ste14